MILERRRRTKFDLRKAEERAHILEGLLIALDHLDAVIALIRASQTPEEAKDGLMSQFGLSEIQAKAILDMRLQRITGLERDKIREEHAELMKTIAYLKEVLADEGLRLKIIKEETLEIKEKYGDKRRTQIIEARGDMRMEDLIADEAVVVTISHLGYIKRTALTEFRTQGRGGVGSKGSTTRDEDFLEHLFVATNARLSIGKHKLKIRFFHLRVLSRSCIHGKNNILFWDMEYCNHKLSLCCVRNKGR